MNFSRFFVDRPIFAAVVSIIIFAVGLISIPNLPVSEYPEVVPPSVVVRTVYPGANPKVIAETVATPLEESINGVEGMMYLKSVAGSDGVLQMTVTFRPDIDADDATVRVQNRVSQALARLPEDVRRQGVTTQKQSPTFLMVVHLTSPDGRYDTLYLRNYARLHVRDALARIRGVGDAQVFGGGDYAMRAWLDPDKIAARSLTAADVVGAMREQNVQVSAGQLGAEPMPDSDFLTLINARGRLRTVQEFGDIVLKSGDDGEIVRLSDVARLELGAGDYTLRARLDGQDAVAMGIFQAFVADPDVKQSVAEWQALGVRPANQDSFAGNMADQRAALLLPAGHKGPAFLLQHNFSTIMRYNNSSSYALAIGLLSERFQDGGRIVADWPTDDRPLSRSERIELQTLLTEKSLEPGGIDGIIGANTRRAIRSFQQQQGWPADGYASVELLEALRRP